MKNGRITFGDSMVVPGGPRNSARQVICHASQAFPCGDGNMGHVDVKSMLERREDFDRTKLPVNVFMLKRKACTSRIGAFMGLIVNSTKRKIFSLPELVL